MRLCPGIQMYFKRNGKSMATLLRNDKYGIFLVLVSTYIIITSLVIFVTRKDMHQTSKFTSSA